MLFQLLEDCLTQFVAAKLLRLQVRFGKIETELIDEFFFKALDVPLVGTNALPSELVKKSAKNSADVVFENQLALINAFEQLAAQTVYRLALLVHHVVVFQQVLTRFEVLRLDSFLRSLDALGDHLRLNGHA